MSMPPPYPRPNRAAPDPHPGQPSCLRIRLVTRLEYSPTLPPAAGREQLVGGQLYTQQLALRTHFDPDPTTTSSPWTANRGPPLLARWQIHRFHRRPDVRSGLYWRRYLLSPAAGGEPRNVRPNSTALHPAWIYWKDAKTSCGVSLVKSGNSAFTYVDLSSGQDGSSNSSTLHRDDGRLEGSLVLRSPMPRGRRRSASFVVAAPEVFVGRFGSNSEQITHLNDRPETLVGQGRIHRMDQRRLPRNSCRAGCSTPPTTIPRRNIP